MFAPLAFVVACVSQPGGKPAPDDPVGHDPAVEAPHEQVVTTLEDDADVTISSEAEGLDDLYGVEIVGAAGDVNGDGYAE